MIFQDILTPHSPTIHNEPTSTGIYIHACAMSILQEALHGTHRKKSSKLSGLPELPTLK